MDEDTRCRLAEQVESLAAQQVLLIQQMMALSAHVAEVAQILRHTPSESDDKALH